MLQLSTAAILEKNKIAQDSVWITLLEVNAPDGEVIRLCYNTEDITWNKNLWVAFPFMIDEIKQNKTEMPQVPVKISNVTRAIERYIEQYGGFINCKVVIRVVNSKYLNQTIPEIEETFVIQKTSSDAEWAKFDLGGSLPLKMRFPFRRILKDWCQCTYKGIECGAISDLPDCPHTLKGCRERNNAVRFEGEPAMQMGGIYVSNS